MSFLHLTVASTDLHAALAENEVTAIAYEVMQEPDGRLPVLMPMSETAGRLGAGVRRPVADQRGAAAPAFCSAACLEWPAASSSSSARVAGPRGSAGFVGIGAQVIVLDIDVKRLREVDEMFNGTVSR